VVFSWKGRDLVAVSNRDGKLYLLDSASLGGTDHKTPLATSAKYASNTTDYAPGALTSWSDSSGTRWILAAAAGAPFTNGAIVAFKVSDEQGKPVLTQAWTSRDLISPVAPVVVNGVAFALSSGEFHSNDATMTAAQRAQRSQPAVLYALDAFTGKELWNSGRTITSFAPHSAGLAFSTGQIYVVTYDNTIYAFGFEQKEN
jgi:outer membrane protein assembly factor BamB